MIHTVQKHYLQT